MKKLLTQVSRFRGTVTGALLGGLYSSFHPIIRHRHKLGSEGIEDTVGTAANAIDRKLEQEGALPPGHATRAWGSADPLKLRRRRG